MPKFTKEDYKNPSEMYDANTLTDITYNHLTTKNYKQAQSRSQERRENIRFSPSQIGRSDRDIVLYMLGYIGVPKDGRVITIMDNGTSFHERIEKTFEDAGIMVAPELSLKDPDLRISGRSDAIIWNYLREEDEEDGPEIKLEDPDGNIVYEGPNNYVLLVEFKSISENGFYKLPKTKPKKEHEEQLQLYFYMTGIDKGIVYYENKNNQATQEYIVERDDEMIKEIVARIKRLIKRAEERDIPAPETPNTHFDIMFTDFKDMSYPNENPFSSDSVLSLIFDAEEGE